MTDQNIHPTIKGPVLVLVGPTAIGKTELSIKIAHHFDCEVVSLDSMQVYRYMDIGTAKILPEEMCGITHHLIDIVNPDENYNAARFVEDALEVICKIHQRKKIPLLTGGTGLYLNALTHGLFEKVPPDRKVREVLVERIKEEGSVKLYEELQLIDKKYADKIHPNDTSRIIRALEVFITTGITLSDHIARQARLTPSHIFSNIYKIGLTCERAILYDQINKRTSLMLGAGFEHEVKMLLERGYDPNLKSMQSIGYRHMVSYIKGDWTREDLYVYLSRDTRRYAKRQLTWFKKDQTISWLQKNQQKKIISSIANWLGS